jgi:hypothetical protein
LIVTLLLVSDFSQVFLPSGTAESKPSLGTFFWKAGEPFPTENGVTIYPPSIPTGNAGPDASPHWYAGTKYNGPDGEANFVETEITTPSSEPSSNQYYYLALSVWDNLGDYDQIGISAYHGLWGLAWSTSDGSCADPAYSFDPFAVQLNLSTRYIFTMSVVSNSSNPGSDAVGYALIGNSQLLWSHGINVPSVTFFYIQRAFCSSLTTNDYQNYEEIYKGGIPTFSFEFFLNAWCQAGSNCSSVTFASWIPWKSKSPGFVAPKQVSVQVDASGVTIDN